VLIWMTGESTVQDVWASVSRDGGRTLAEPRRLGTSQPRGAYAKPSVSVVSAGGTSIGERPGVVALWPTTTGDGRGGVVLARSNDLGESFQVSTTSRPHGLPEDAILSSSAIAPDGRWHALWTAQGSDLYYSSGDGSATTAARRLDDAMSRCGISAVAAGPVGAVHVFWHRRFGQHDEEFAHVASSGAGGRFTAVARVSHERWQFASCPGRSPSLSVDADGAVRFVFQAVLPGAEALSSVFSDTTADGQRFRPRMFLGAASGFAAVRHPHLAPDGAGGLSLAWDGIRNNRRYVVIRHSLGAPGGAGGLEADWLRLAPPIVLDHTGDGSAPVVARAGEGLLAAWITGSPAGSVVAARRMSIEELCGRPRPSSLR
jgi:hypothetical protein